MGQATIKANLGEGKYTIEINRDFARAEAELAVLDSKITELEENIVKYDEKILKITDEELPPLVQNLQYLIGLEAAAPGIDKEIEKAITIALKDLTKKVYEKQQLLYKKDIDQLLIESKKKKKTQINNAISSKQHKQIEAWCADYSNKLSVGALVGTIETDDDTLVYTPQTLIKPGGVLKTQREAAATYIQPTISSGPSAVFYNLSLLPGKQKWKPYYRKGTIDYLFGNSCNVTLDTAYSSQHPRGLNLSINARPNLVAIPIEYMSCNGAAFKVGDRVIVDFGGHPAAPKVIGFVSNPKPCTQTDTEIIYYLTCTITGKGNTSGTSGSDTNCEADNYWDAPDDENGSFNSPDIFALGATVTDESTSINITGASWVGASLKARDMKIQHYWNQKKMQWHLTSWVYMLANGCRGNIKKRTILKEWDAVYNQWNIISTTDTYVSGSILGTVTFTGTADDGTGSISISGGGMTFSLSCGTTATNTGTASGFIKTIHSPSCGIYAQRTEGPTDQKTAQVASTNGVLVYDLKDAQDNPITDLVPNGYVGGFLIYTYPTIKSYRIIANTDRTLTVQTSISDTTIGSITLQPQALEPGGTITSFGSNSISDSNQYLVTNYWIGGTLTIGGQVKTVTSNTATDIYVNSDFNPAVSAGQTYTLKPKTIETEASMNVTLTANASASWSP